MAIQKKWGSRDTNRQTATKQEACSDFVHCNLLISTDMVAINSEPYNNRDAWKARGS